MFFIEERESCTLFATLIDFTGANNTKKKFLYIVLSCLYFSNKSVTTFHTCDHLDLNFYLSVPYSKIEKEICLLDMFNRNESL